MSTSVIELNDVGVAVYTADGLSFASPGYAMTSDAGIQVGSEAYAQARLHPRSVSDRFWDELSLEPLPRQGGSISSNADLACAHLAHVWDRARAGVERVLLVVPGNLSRQQLGLLLGIAQECQMPVAGMIDAAVAASAQPYPGRSLCYVDVQLHRFVATRLAQGTQLSRAGVEAIPQGLAALRDAWVKDIAAVFLKTTRFDPLHGATTEQALYDGLSDWLESIARNGTVEARVASSNGKTHTVTLRADRMMRVAEPTYRGVVELIQSTTRAGEQLTLQVSSRLAALPGLTALLGELPDCEIVALDADAAMRGALAQQERVLSSDGENINFVTHVPWRLGGGEVRAPDGPAPEAGEQPTHLLYRGRAYAIGAESLVVGSEIPAGTRGIAVTGQLRGVSRRHCSVRGDGAAVVLEDHSSFGTFLNGARVEARAALRIGDRVRVGTPGHELELISVVK